uniref:Uncharacterized protein n=1 Tax=Glossina palpalis gambiensis TaxID=67801 RepID=A0A1B0AQE5_9MUSC
MAVINSWVLYKKKNNLNLKLGDSRSELAEILCSYEKYDGSKRGRLTFQFINISVQLSQRANNEFYFLIVILCWFYVILLTTLPMTLIVFVRTE